MHCPIKYRYIVYLIQFPIENICCSHLSDLEFSLISFINDIFLIQRKKGKVVRK